MQGGVSIYPSQSMPFKWAIGATVVYVLVITVYFVVRYIMHQRAMAIQRELSRVNTPNLAEVIGAALAEIEHVRAGVQDESISPSSAAGRLSKVSRETFDFRMNHRTMYQSRSEVVARRLDKVGTLLDKVYPVEYSGKTYSKQDAFELCDTSKELVESCR